RSLREPKPTHQIRVFFATSKWKRQNQRSHREFEDRRNRSKRPGSALGPNATRAGSPTCPHAHAALAPAARFHLRQFLRRFRRFVRLESPGAEVAPAQPVAMNATVRAGERRSPEGATASAIALNHSFLA